MRVVMWAHGVWARRPWVAVASLAAMSRALWALGAALGTRWPLDLSRFAHVDPRGHGYVVSTRPWIDVWCRWDARFYLTIAESGYLDAVEDLRVAFFPLFPLLVRAVAHLTHWGIAPAAITVANLADIAGWLCVAQLARRRLSQRAFWAVLAFVLFPTRNFGFSAYTEGVFLAFSAAAFYCFETRRHRLAALCCGAAALARPQGCLIGAALGATAVAAAWRRQAFAPSWRQASLYASGPLALAGFMAYLNHRYGDPLAFLHVQHVWRRHSTFPVAALFSHGEPVDHVATWTALLCLVAMFVWRVPLQDRIYCSLSVCIPLATGSVMSMARFVGVLFPLFFIATELSCRPTPPAWARWYARAAVIVSLILAFKLGRGAKVV